MELSPELESMRLEKVDANSPGQLVPKEEFAVLECMALHREVLSGDVVI